MKPAFPPARSGAADSYGPYVSEELIVKALAPYPPDLVIATYGEDRASGTSLTYTFALLKKCETKHTQAHYH